MVDKAVADPQVAIERALACKRDTSPEMEDGPSRQKGYQVNRTEKQREEVETAYQILNNLKPVFFSFGPPPVIPQGEGDGGDAVVSGGPPGCSSAS